MADRNIRELPQAYNLRPADLLVAEQDGQAKKYSAGQLTAWLTSLADGHGGIQSTAKTGTEGRTDTYTITYADGTSSTFTVTNGEQGPKGSPPTITGTKTEYAVTARDSVAPPILGWTPTMPDVPGGSYLWARTTITFDSGESTFLSKTRWGINGKGSVSSINQVDPDASGNVTLTPQDVGALDERGGTMQGAIDMDGSQIRNLPKPTLGGDAAPKSYVDDTFGRMSYWHKTWQTTEDSGSYAHTISGRATADTTIFASASTRMQSGYGETEIYVKVNGTTIADTKHRDNDTTNGNAALCVPFQVKADDAVDILVKLTDVGDCYVNILSSSSIFWNFAGTLEAI